MMKMTLNNKENDLNLVADVYGNCQFMRKFRIMFLIFRRILSVIKYK